MINLKQIVKWLIYNQNELQIKKLFFTKFFIKILIKNFLINKILIKSNLVSF